MARPKTLWNFQVKVAIYRGGVTGSPVTEVFGLGDTIAGAIRDALTAGPAQRIRDKDYLRVVEVKWLR